MISLGQYIKFLSEARKFFQLGNSFRKSMPVLKDDVIKSVAFTCVSDHQKATLDELSILAAICFPYVVPQEDITQLETEFLEYQCASEKELPSYLNENKTPKLILFGMKLQRSVIHVLFNQNLNIYLPKLVKFLLLISHSNVYCES